MRPRGDSRPLLDALALELERCNKCGFCLSACPTYLAEPREWLVTRGRISLIQDVVDGRLDLHDPDFREALESCLMCRACVAACPPQVQIDQLVGLTRAQRRQEAGLGLMERAVYRFLLPHPRVLSALLTMLAPLDRPGLRRLALRSRAISRREPLARALALGPALPGVTGRGLIARERERERERPDAPGGPRSSGVPGTQGRPEPRLVYFLGCSKNLLYPQAALATYRLLRRQGFEVEIPLVGCCGLPNSSAGDREGAQALARRNLRALEATRARTIVVDESSCCAHLSSYGQLFEGQPEASRMAELAARMVDLSVLLDREGIQQPGPLPRRVVWHDPCHLRHHQGVTEAPRRLLEQVPGTVLVEPDLEPGCCGGAGSIMLTKGRLSDLVLERRLAAFRRAGAELIVTGSPSCVSQYARATDGLPVVYLSEYLESAYRGD